MSIDVTRRRFMGQTLGVVGGTMVSGSLLPLLAEAAQHKPILRVAVERDFETRRPELSAGSSILPLSLPPRISPTCARCWGYVDYPDAVPVLSKLSLG